MNEQEAIKDCIQTLFKAFDETDEQLFRSVTHPMMRTVNIGNSNAPYIFSALEVVENTIVGLRNAMDKMPGFFAVREDLNIQRIEVHEVIATAEISYTMRMPDSAGHHYAYLHFINLDGRWLLMQMVDRGIEEKS